MWLWTISEHIAFNLFERATKHNEYADDDQFTQVATRMAEVAADRILGYRDMFQTPREAANRLAAGQRTLANDWNAGLAVALAGDIDAARRHLAKFAAHEARSDWSIKQRDDAGQLTELTDPSALTAAVRERIRVARAALTLSGDWTWLPSL